MSKTFQSWMEIKDNEIYLKMSQAEEKNDSPMERQSIRGKDANDQK